jgi:gliding motility-associated-like protein
MKATFLFFILTIGACYPAIGQTTEWIRGMGNTTAVLNLGCVDEFGGSYQLCLSYDTLQLDNLTTYSKNGRITGLVKRNDKGHTIWTKLIKGVPGTSLLLINSISADKAGGIYFSLYFNQDSVFVGNYLITNESQSSYNDQLTIVKIDTSGNVKWHTNLTVTTNSVSNSIGSFDPFFNSSVITANSNHVVMNFGCYEDSIKIKNKFYKFKYKNDDDLLFSIIINLNSTNGQVKYVHELEVKSYAKAIQSVSLLNDDVYAVFSAFGYNDSFDLKSKRYGHGNYIYKINSSGKLTKLHRYGLVRGYISNRTSIVASENKLYLAGTFYDSLLWNNSRTGLDTVMASPFVVCVDTNFNEIFTNITANSTAIFPFSQPDQGKCIAADGNFTYVLFRVFLYSGEQVTFLDQTFTGPIINGQIVTKLDEKGNVLWNFNFEGCSGSEIDVYPKGDLMIAGYYNKKFRIFNDSLGTYNRNIPFPFVAKIKDYNITRGDVSKGPYCAGDSFKLNFTAFGSYQAHNEFTAELSDENGNFTDTLPFYKMGSIKAVKDSFINCKFPKTQLSTSGSYRIRILSSSPRVQSFYKQDTLRMLIYSRDTADLGRDTVICAGKSITLFTYGGTKWEWSPDSNVLVKNGPRLQVRPSRTRMYRVVITDSSGCGVTDKDSIQVMVRQPLTIVHDTVISFCLNETLNLSPMATGGLSTGYKFTYQIDSAGKWYNITNNTQKVTKDIRARIILSDACSALNDTLQFNVKLDTNSNIKTTLAGDTLICPNAKGKFKLTANSCNDQFTYTWKFLSLNTYIDLVSDTTDTLSYFPAQEGYIVAIVKNTFTGKSARDSLFVKLKPRLLLQKINDTLICFGTNLNTDIHILKGVAPYVYEWRNFDSSSIHTSGTIVQTIRKTTRFVIKAADDCKTEGLDTFDVMIKPLPTIDFSIDTQYCFGASLISVATLTNSVPAYTFNWLLDNAAFANTQSINTTLTKEDTGTLTLQFRDACTDSTFTLVKNFNVLPAIKANAIGDTTICDGTTLNYTSAIRGGNGNYSITWLNVNTNNTSQNPIFNITPTATATHIRRMITDYCSQPDTQDITITKLAPLSVVFTGDTVLCEGKSTQWDLDPSGGNGNYQYTWTSQSSGTIFNTVNNFIFQSPNTDVIKINMTDKCSLDSVHISKSLIVVPYAKASLDIKPLAGCEPLVASINNTSLNASTYKLNGNIITAFPVTGVYTVSTNNKIVFIATNTTGCADTIDYGLQVYPRPKAKFTFLPVKPILQDEILFTNMTDTATTYNWSKNNVNFSTSTDARLIAEDTFVNFISLEAINKYGCRDTFTQSIKFNNPFIYFLPNAFSPNNDGTNEVFVPSITGMLFYTLEIYNFWGEKIFEGNMRGWDGTYQGSRVPSGHYLWRISMESDSHQKKYANGTVLVLY